MLTYARIGLSFLDKILTLTIITFIVIITIDSLTEKKPDFKNLDDAPIYYTPEEVKAIHLMEERELAEERERAKLEAKIQEARIKAEFHKAELQRVEREQQSDKLKAEGLRVAKINLELKNKIRERECGKNDVMCKNKAGNYKVYQDGQRKAVGIASNNYCLQNSCELISELPLHIVEIQFEKDINEKIRIAKKNIWYYDLLSAEEQHEVIDFYYQQKGGFHNSGMHFHLDKFYKGEDASGRQKAKKIWLKYTMHHDRHGKKVSLRGLAVRSQKQVDNFFSEKAMQNAMKQVAKFKKPEVRKPAKAPTPAKPKAVKQVRTPEKVKPVQKATTKQTAKATVKPAPKKAVQPAKPKTKNK